MNIITTTTKNATVKPVDVAQRNSLGQFTEGYPGHTLARMEEQQKRVAQTDSNPDHLAFLAAHGLAHIAPSEIFASR